MREFDWNAIRSNVNWKIHYFWFTHPAVEQSFWRYMKKHQTCEDWSTRSADNWWWWWSKNVSIDSMARHMKDIEALRAWMYVYKIKRIIDDEISEETRFEFNEIDTELLIAADSRIKSIEIVDEEEAINWIKFNCNAYILAKLKWIE